MNNRQLLLNNTVIYFRTSYKQKSMLKQAFCVLLFLIARKYKPLFDKNSELYYNSYE